MDDIKTIPQHESQSDLKIVEKKSDIESKKNDSVQRIRAVENNRQPSLVEPLSINKVTTTEPDFLSIPKPKPKPDTEELEVELLEGTIDLFEDNLTEFEDDENYQETYIGELLLSFVVDFIETPITEFEDDDYQNDFINFIENNSLLLNDSESNQFDSYLQTLEEEQVDVIKDVINNFIDAIKEVNSLPEEIYFQKKDILQENFEKLTKLLFESLDLEYNDEMIKYFVFNIFLLPEFTNKISEKKFSIDELNKMGTYEYKPFDSLLLSSVLRYFQYNIQSYLMIGQYALKVFFI